MSTHNFNALVCTQNKQDFYIAVLPTEILQKVCYVSSRDKDPKEGFQRSLNESRAKDIANYMNHRDGVIPSAIILSAQDAVQFTYNRNNNTISFKENMHGFMVLDGQHRLYGLFKSEKNYDIPVVIFNHLNTTDEVNLFIDINTTQKGVPTTLLLDIKNLSGKETKKEDKQRKLFDLLNEDSVMAGLFSPHKSKVGKITRVVFNQATNEIFESGFFKDKDVGTIYKGLKNYLAALETTLVKSKSQKAKITNGLIFKSALGIFQDIIDLSLEKHGNLKEEALAVCLEPISRINYDSFTGTSNTTYTTLLNEMREEIKKEKRDQYDEVNTEDLF
ncbi:DGQHR domain-containing protein [Acinetobacter baumannii]